MKEKQIEKYVRDNVSFLTSREYDSWVKSLAQRVIGFAEDARLDIDSKYSYTDLLDEVIRLSDVAYKDGYDEGFKSSSW